MARTVIVHILGEEPVMGEIERDPEPTDMFVHVNNLRRRDGKDVNYLTPGCESVIFPWSRVTFLEFMVDEQISDDVIDFFRLE